MTKCRRRGFTLRSQLFTQFMLIPGVKPHRARPKWFINKEPERGTKRNVQMVLRSKWRCVVCTSRKIHVPITIYISRCVDGSQRAFHEIHVREKPCL